MTFGVDLVPPHSRPGRPRRDRARRLRRGHGAAAGLAALATGWIYERIQGRVLYALPPLVATVPALAFANTPLVALTGVLLWGAATGIQDSTVKALVVALVPPMNRATAYGVFAAIQGATAIAGGLLAGALYARSLPLLVAIIATFQAVAFGLLVASLRPEPEPTATAPHESA